MLRYLVQSIRKTALAAPPFHLFKAILQCLRHRFGFSFAGQGRQIGSQFFVSWFRMFKAMFHYG